jgi:hypothetical protein
LTRFPHWQERGGSPSAPGKHNVRSPIRQIVKYRRSVFVFARVASKRFIKPLPSFSARFDFFGENDLLLFQVEDAFFVSGYDRGRRRVCNTIKKLLDLLFDFFSNLRYEFS